MIDGANVNDHLLLEITLESIPIGRPLASPEAPQNLCLDKGYDYAVVPEILEEFGYTPHLRSRGEEKVDLSTLPGHRARRWVVERTHSWLNRFRSILIRWSKKPKNHLALLQFAAGLIAFRMAGVMG